MSPPEPSDPHQLVVLDKDHPGFRDLGYRARRNAIARLALDHRGGPAPRVDYTPEEHDTWRRVRARLDPLHRERVAAMLVEAADRLALPAARIPQLAEVSARLGPATGFRLEPVAGLIAARAFLVALGEGVFLSTQYLRHASAPFYTPEPDVIHELVGHAASLTCPRVAAASRALGLAARRADDEGVRALERVYWRSLEFGAVAEGGLVKGFGAGLLSSVGELERLAAAEHVPWDVATAAAEPYDPTDYQPRYWVAPSADRLLDDLLGWVRERFRIHLPAA